jgi:hypothetical protein
MPAKYTPEQQTAAFWSKADKSGGDDSCWNWIGAKGRDMYGHVRWNGRVTGAHRVAFELTSGGLPSGLDVLHSCDNTLCVNPRHLFAGTHDDNMRDKMQKGRANNLRGERNPSCKLSDAQVADIRRLYAQGGTTYQKIADMYGVDQSNIALIVKRLSRV